MHYRKINEKWATIAWWGLDGSRDRYLAFQDGSYATSNNSVFYYYVEAPDKSFSWNSGKLHYSVSGRKVAISKMEDKQGDAELRLTCVGY